MGSVKRECLRQFIFISEDHLRRTAASFVRYYNDTRTHQGIVGIPAVPTDQLRARYPIPANNTARLVSKPVLGGLRHDYRLVA